MSIQSQPPIQRQPEIRTARLLLRALRDSDIAAFAAMYADPRVMEFYPARLTRDETEAQVERIRANVREHGFGIWAVEIPGAAEFIGIAGLTHATFEAAFTPCIELVWRLVAEHWGKGYATEAARASIRFGFDDLQLDEILAWTTPLNAASRRVMEKLGMTHDPADDFDHPRLPQGHRLRKHVLYRLTRSQAAEAIGLRQQPHAVIRSGLRAPMSANVKVYVTRSCGYCVLVKQLLDRKGVAYETIDVTHDPDVRAWLTEVTGRRTIPQVLIDDKPYGGYTDLATLDSRGELDALLGLAP